MIEESVMMNQLTTTHLHSVNEGMKWVFCVFHKSA